MFYYFSVFYDKTIDVVYKIPLIYFFFIKYVLQFRSRTFFNCNELNKSVFYNHEFFFSLAFLLNIVIMLKLLSNAML